MSSQIKNIVGQRFGRLIAKKPTKKRIRGSVVWECVCECKQMVEVTSFNLCQGHTQSCGCLRRNDLTNQRFGRLMVKKLTEKKIHTNLIWECKCDCGRVVEVQSKNLREGCTQSCGCYQKQRVSETHTVDITGNRYGKLIAIKPTTKKVGSNTVWECLCDCGRIKDISLNNLTVGNTQSCGCLRSRGNNQIVSILTTLNIKHFREYRFKDCKDILPLPFDVYISHLNTCIEYQGEQHYRPVPFGGISPSRARKNLKQTKKHDKIKQDYCQTNGIKLILIPHWDYYRIEEIINAIVQEISGLRL